MVTAALSAAVIIAITAFLAMRDETPHVRRVGVLSVATTSTTAVAFATAAPPAPPVAPAALTIPTIAVNAPVVPVGVEPGTSSIEVPSLDHVGWYRFAATPGAPGSTVLLGHVDGQGRQGVFFRLGTLEPGDAVQIRMADGSIRGFHIIGRSQFLKSALPTDLFSKAGPSRLVLITCGGAFDASIHHYRDNVVVVAVPDR